MNRFSDHFRGNHRFSCQSFFYFYQRLPEQNFIQGNSNWSLSRCNFFRLFLPQGLFWWILFFISLMSYVNISETHILSCWKIDWHYLNCTLHVSPTEQIKFLTRRFSFECWKVKMNLFIIIAILKTPISPFFKTLLTYEENYTNFTKIIIIVKLY